MQISLCVDFHIFIHPPLGQSGISLLIGDSKLPLMHGYVPVIPCNGIPFMLRWSQKINKQVVDFFQNHL